MFTFLEAATRAKVSQTSEVDGLLQSASVQVIQTYFVQRVKFLEVVGGAYNSGVADAELISNFFQKIIVMGIYKSAVKVRTDAWPELNAYLSKISDNTLGQLRARPG